MKEIETTLAITNLTLIQNDLFISVDKLPLNKREKRLKVCNELSEAVEVIQSQYSTLRWYNEELPNVNALRLENYELKQKIKQLESQIEKLKENISL